SGDNGRRMKEDVFPMELMSPSGDTSWRYVAGCSLRAERSEPIRVSDSASGTVVGALQLASQNLSFNSD
ncbi:hypothetical protein, partial [Ferrimicrobium acidiphilum]|uniref:hypothetical protein n=1 Tax=Ferrimicrobium acidiphilum TaxID=121039 RepID=UPI0023F0E4C1